MWQSEKSDAKIAAAIRDGLPGTAMPPSDAGAEQIANMVSYIRMLPVTRGDVPTLASPDSLDPQQIAQRVRSLLSQAIVAAGAGRTDDANDLAFDAYIAFEPLETSTRAKAPGLIRRSNAGSQSSRLPHEPVIRSTPSEPAMRSRQACRECWSFRSHPPESGQHSSSRS